MQVHGANIQPFGYQDRADFLVSLDQAIDDITLDNIELLAVEEFLPASGPSAESLMNLFGSNAVYKSPKAAGSPPPAPPPSGAAPCLDILYENKHVRIIDNFTALVEIRFTCTNAFLVLNKGLGKLKKMRLVERSHCSIFGLLQEWWRRPYWLGSLHLR